MMGVITFQIGILTDLSMRRIADKCSDSHMVPDEDIYRWILCYALIIGHFIERFLEKWGRCGQAACGVLAVYLLVSSVQDSRTCEVYDFLHIPPFLTGLLCTVCLPGERRILPILLYIGFQIMIFMRMYGAADGMVFMVCAVFENCFGKGTATFLMHMAAAYLLLALIQGIRRNIGRDGNLKQPVPFVPYIAATVWFFL